LEIATDIENFDPRVLVNGSQHRGANRKRTFDAGDGRQQQVGTKRGDKRGSNLDNGNVHSVMIPEEWGSENSVGGSSGRMRDDPMLVDKFREIEKG
jgi:hypothetical protein